MELLANASQSSARRPHQTPPRSARTAGRIVSRNVSASNLRTSGQQAELGGLLNAELTLARRGLV